ncbi:GNAT family N-acetyltransferase [Amnibacterium sp. CER49]|uniref:GNAT family N-acetyltransferase n=1 Tax=Amnibacterium sp. CER49 TaxID=3039161 RepID=UPI0024486EC2|nr:GNAT family N-acetyltransferase [Amnibacterium sp. CER49]MDH2444792.1 GNAT family N-acetyltransferase [Amnibacterium sp. CER49]
MDPSPPRIRPAVPADAQALGRMHHAAWREAYASILLPGWFDDHPIEERIERWAHHLGSPTPGTTVLVAEDAVGGVILGHTIAGPARATEALPAVRDRELYSLYVLAAAYGTGLGRRLLDAALPDAAPAQLWVFEANARARRFYEQAGFRLDGARQDASAELGGAPEIRMVR